MCNMFPDRQEPHLAIILIFNEYNILIIMYGIYIDSIVIYVYSIFNKRTWILVTDEYYIMNYHIYFTSYFDIKYIFYLFFTSHV